MELTWQSILKVCVSSFWGFVLLSFISAFMFWLLHLFIWYLGICSAVEGICELAILLDLILEW
jgi:hypothetical protein